MKICSEYLFSSGMGMNNNHSKLKMHHITKMEPKQKKGFS